MPDPAEILARVRAKGANILLDQGKLSISNSGRLTQEARTFIFAHARAIAGYLDKEAEFEERAAILEYDGGHTRPVAEDLASILYSSATPEGVSTPDWNFFVGKAAAICDRARAERKRAGA